MVELVASRLAEGLARVRLHKVELRNEVVRKRRRRLAALLLGPGNRLTARRAVPVEVLDEPRWWRRELDVARALGRSARLEPGGWLRLERLPGVPLSVLLRDGEVSRATKLDALRMAARALATLQNALGQSHGDATVNNVICDLDQAEAQWLDFDAAHRPGRPIEQRRADDLRALCFSTAGAAPELDEAELFGAALSAFGDEAVLTALEDLLKGEALRRDLWHLAQAAASPAGRDRCRRALLLTLEAKEIVT